jgi:hypothetical protein
MCARLGLITGYGLAGVIRWSPHLSILVAIFGTTISPYLFFRRAPQDVRLPLIFCVDHDGEDGRSRAGDRNSGTSGTPFASYGRENV